MTILCHFCGKRLAGSGPGVIREGLCAACREESRLAWVMERAESGLRAIDDAIARCSGAQLVEVAEDLRARQAAISARLGSRVIVGRLRRAK